MTETASRTTRWDTLEQWSPTAFLVGGVLLVVAAAAAGAIVFMDGERSTVGSVVGPAGLAVGFIGLLGLYPQFVDQNPWLARAGAVFAALGAIGYAGISLGNLGSVVGGTAEGPPTLAIVFIPALAIGTLLGFSSFSIASLRTDNHSRTVGFLLLVPTALFAVMLASEIIGYTPVWDNLVITSGQAVALLAIGYSLRAGPAAPDREEAESASGEAPP